MAGLGETLHEISPNDVLSLQLSLADDIGKKCNGVDFVAVLLAADGANLAALAAEFNRMAAQLAAAADERGRMESTRRELIAAISHDLRTPLASILGTVSSLRSFPERYGAAEREELLATLQDEAERLNRFVSNLLDMTRIESGAIELKLELIDVTEIIGSALQRAGNVLAGHRVEVAIDSGLPMLRLDAVLFEQVLFNLLDNAAKYAPIGTIVRIQSWRERDFIGLQVLDEGEGIPPGDIEHIFDKFYRARKIDHVRAGTGLGLAITLDIVERHGGTIALEEADGGGARFVVSLPRSTPENDGQN